jgi:NAD(P)-dependent dehydrogenase (short-subunit alcohol dehydrogenase family)
MDLQLSGKTAIVTGASRGVGLATVRALGAEGVRVLGAARSITPELRETGAVAVSVDLSTPQGAQELLTRATAELNGIDLLVNNVGGPADWRSVDSLISTTSTGVRPSTSTSLPPSGSAGPRCRA